MRILIQGDSHGNPDDILPKIYKAGDYRIDKVFVVGDFGLWTHKADGHTFLDEVQEAARINNLSVFAIGGNHENWDHWNWVVENHPTSKGFAYLRSRILIAPKAHRWTWANKQFISAGGAVSVDRDNRLMLERGYIPDGNGGVMPMSDPVNGKRIKPSGLKTLWWPNEQLTDQDVVEIAKWGKADYLITHDCSNYTPFKGRLKNDPESERHRRRIDEVLKSTSPDMHWHGHMHTKYDWVNDYSGGGARTLGLEAFKDTFSWGVLDVPTGQWWWPHEYDKALAERKARKAAHDQARGGGK